VWDLPKWYSSALRAVVIEVFLLIALGGAVRVMDAGLACPDWPLCFGDYIPDYHPQVYLEFLHRVMAGVVSVTLAVLAYFLWFRSRAPARMKWLMGLVLVLLFSQVILGGLTVLWQLHAKVVAAHLGFATGIFALLLWMHLQMKPGLRARAVRVSGWQRGLRVLALLFVYGQIWLGGMVASHLAALVCTDFPTCHGQWFPTFEGIIGLHVMHRLGAYTVFILALVTWFTNSDQRDLKWSRWFVVGVISQMALGVANLKLLTPPVLAVAHLSLATALLAVAVRQVHAAFYQAE